MAIEASKSNHPFESRQQRSSVSTKKGLADRRSRPLLLLSIRPEFGQLILDGKKTVELRRIRPRVEAGQWAVIYLSSPRKALAGAFQIRGIEEGKPSELWRRIGKQTGIGKSDFDRYFEGVNTAFALVVGKVIRIQAACSLESIRRIWPDFRPPQLYRYLPRNHPLVSAQLGVLETPT